MNLRLTEMFQGMSPGYSVVVVVGGTGVTLRRSDCVESRVDGSLVAVFPPSSGLK